MSTHTQPIPAAVSAADTLSIAAPSDAATGSARTQLSAIVELTKPRITRLVTITSAVGFTLAGVGRTWYTLELIVAAMGCLAGTALSAAGANALNQWWERERDARMPRTARRPLPQNRLSPKTAVLSGLAFSIVGVLVLLLTCGPAPALVSLATILIYVLAYTPLKPITTLNTLVGAVPGALPPLIGWTAAAGSGSAYLAAASGTPTQPFDSLLQAGGWSLFVLMLVWQIPHFLAIAWMYRDDYAKGGYRMLPISDPTGTATSATILVWAAALIPATLAPALVLQDRLSAVYTMFAVITGALYLALCIRLARTKTVAHAKSVFLASIMHLPLLLIVLVADALLSAI